MSAEIIIPLIAVLFFIFPLFPSVYLSVNSENKTFNSEFTIFGITFFKANIKAVEGKFVIKRTFKKTYFLSVIKSVNTKNKMPKVKGVKILRATVNIIFSTDDIVKSALIWYALKSAENYFLKRVLTFKYEGNYFGIENKSALNAAVKLVIVFNLIDVIFNLFLCLSEKIFYAIGKQQN